MSKYDKYKTQSPRESLDSKYAKYRVMPTSKEQENPLVNHLKGFHGESGDAWWQLPKKAVGKFATEIAGLPHLAARGVEAMTNAGNKMYGAPVGMYGMGTYGKGRENPPNIRVDENARQTNYAQLIPSTESIQKGVRPYIDIEPRPSNAAQRVAYEGLDFGLNSLPFSQVNKLAKGASLLDKFSKVGKTAGIGAGIGATSGIAQEAGTPKLAADIGASILAPKLNPKNIYSAFKKIPETATKVGHKIMGLGPKSLNVEAAQAARDLGIDLPTAALTNSKLTSLADAYIGKTPYFGDKLGKKYKEAEAQTRDALERIYEEVGPKNTPEVRELINDLYAERIRALPTDAKVLPVGTKTALDKIGTESFSPSSQEIALMKRRDKIKNKLEPKSSLIAPYEGPARMTAQEALDAGLVGGGRSNNLKMPLQEARVQALIDQKKSLNMDWDEFKGVQEQLKNVHHGIGEDLAAYGKTNPEWYKKMSEADALFASKAKRADLELLLGGSINPSVDQLGYAALSKRIHAPNQLNGIRKQVAPETLAKIEKLGVVARAMAIKNRGVPNPSGTAATASLLGALPSLYVAPGTTIAAVTSTAIATQLLTDKKFIDLALKYAKRPNLVSVVPLNKRIKDVTGYSAVALNRELQRAQEREE